MTVQLSRHIQGVGPTLWWAEWSNLFVIGGRLAGILANRHAVTGVTDGLRLRLVDSNQQAKTML
jgi:hypothetical protein